ncbi:MAG: Shedu anti-phage system protein SduA domain-containing protein [Candidatus Scalindua sp.]
MKELIRNYYPDDWPPEDYKVNHLEANRKQLENLKALIGDNASETKIENFLKTNKNILANILRLLNTGNQGAWNIPKQVVRPHGPHNQKGHIPDYILGGLSSNGLEWYVLELKGANQKILKETNNILCFSSDANKAICQVIEYIDYCTEAQAYLRDTLKLKDFREPKGLILIGRETEFSNDNRREKFKSAWNRFMKHKIEIRTFDSLLREVESIVNCTEKR